VDDEEAYRHDRPDNGKGCHDNHDIRGAHRVLQLLTI
jgi:hypothetical protein